MSNLSRTRRDFLRLSTAACASLAAASEKAHDFSGWGEEEEKAVLPRLSAFAR